MKDADIDRLAAAAGDHWWYQAKLDLVEQEIAAVGSDRRRAVDAGCGSGHLLDRLTAGGFASVVGIDASPRALVHARDIAPRSELVGGAAEQVPLATGTTACLTSLDVIEHCDDVAAVREHTRVVRRGGIEASASEMSDVSPTVNRLFGRLARLERRVIRHVPVPFGLSVLAICRNP
jgi:2-polyprenyl-3-methyl-5-hydroxy-6-metoxy-1,4-benzoquinol methylase